MNLDSLIQNWRNRPFYEQVVLGLITLFAAMLFVYFLLIGPSAGHYKDAENNLRSAEREAQAIADAVQQVNRLRGQEQLLLPSNEGELRSWFANSAREAQINLTGFLLPSTKYIEIHVEEVASATLFNWLDQLTTSHGLLINKASLNPIGESGFLNADIRLELQ